MNISDFTYLLKEPKEINPEQTEAIESIIKEFPYFQSARAIFLKGLKNQDSFKYNNELKITAAHTADRSVLFEFITSKDFNKTLVIPEENQKEKELAKIEVVDFEELTISKDIKRGQLIKKHLEEAQGHQEALEDITSHQITPEKIAATTNEVSPEEILEIDRPLTFEQSEKHSFNEWLQLSMVKSIDRESKKEIEENQVQKIEPKKDKKDLIAKKLNLIDTFIKNNPRISPVKDITHTINLAESFQVDQNQLMTETLAKVYLSQKKYKKATQAYKILILKYPEKSGFFADQIRAIKKLQKK